MDAIELLKTDHRTIEKLFERLVKSNRDRGLFRELDRELTVHAEVEEKIFYPAARNVAPTRDLVLESIEEHKQIKMVLADVEHSDEASDEWRAALQVLMEDVRHHIGEEEEELFPRIKSKVLSKDQLEDLGRRLEAMKQDRLAAAKSR